MRKPLIILFLGLKIYAFSLIILYAATKIPFVIDTNLFYYF
jgi:hypothetical protein